MAPLQSAHSSICIALGCIRPSPKEILLSSIPSLKKTFWFIKEKCNYADACSESCSRETEALLDRSQAEQYSPLWGMCKIKLPLQWLFCDCVGCRCSWHNTAGVQTRMSLIDLNCPMNKKLHENKILILYDFNLNDHVDKNSGNLHSFKMQQ